MHPDHYIKKAIFYKPDNIKLGFEEMPEYGIHAISSLHIVDTKEGAKLCDFNRFPMFILLPRHEVMEYMLKNKFNIVAAMDNLREFKGRCLRGKNVKGVQIDKGTKYNWLGPAPNTKTHGFFYYIS